MTTALSCRQYETRMHVAMMIDAYLASTENNPFRKCEPGNTFKRIMCDKDFVLVDDYFGMDQVPMHPYAAIWHQCEAIYRNWEWNKLADYEIDRNWEHARKYGMKINGREINASAFIQAQLRWEKNGWLRYEYKRSKRRAAFAPFLRVAAIV